MTKKTALASPPHKLRPIPTSLDGFRLFCLGAIIAVFFGVITLSSFPEVMKTVPEGHAELTLFVARWVLFIELLVLAIRWISGFPN